MFTGLIENVGLLNRRSRLGKAGKLEISTGLPLHDINIGDSIAVNGACLTVETIRHAESTLVFHTLAETLDRTNLGRCPLGSSVNLERALAAGARLGGHFVQGHVDATAPITAVDQSRDDIVITVGLPETLQSLLIPKGSIAINGISLTVSALMKEVFQVSIIPHTWQETNLVDASPGDPVNLEADMIGKYVVRQLELGRPAPTVGYDTLRNAGFLE